MTSKSVLVVGTGTIGEPLIGLLARLKNDLSIDDVYFYKRTPLVDEVSKVQSLCKKGAKLVVKDLHTADKFNVLGHKSVGLFGDLLPEMSAVIDCTPSGNDNKKLYYNNIDGKEKPIFIAQGSEKGFGTPYAYGINDHALAEKKSPYVQVVSCNTHNIACLVKTLDEARPVISGDFVCIRRANDISQDGSFIASPNVGDHSSSTHGTHHARDVYDLFRTTGKIYNLFSSAMKVNSQYMHTIRFSIDVKGSLTKEDAIKIFRDNKFIALTHKKSANKIFSFGRDHGFYGRTYNQTVLPIDSLHVSQGNGTTSVTGFCFTPQDGNSLLSSTAAALQGIHGSRYTEYFPVLDKLLFSEI
tara:strand:+ start:556 stop:1623 length:1068 start_codon:yes stop_codon:yes gene_type:complete